jgi:four helix bundle protein
VGANIREAQEWQSRKDFLSKMSISLKEARESKYRICLLRDSWYFKTYPLREDLLKKSNEMIWVLTKIIKTTKLKL